MTLLRSGQAEKGTILLAHGAGAPANTDFMTAFAEALAAKGFEAVRFNFPYMIKRLEDGKKRPPDRAPKLLEAFRAAIQETKAPGPLIIGGKSMGGRIASMLAAEQPNICDGLLCLGYPFHPPGKPEKLRIEHLSRVKVSSLIVQGERDPFGGKSLLSDLQLPNNFSVQWAPDGNHDLTPRKASGHTADSNWAAAIDTIAEHFG